MSDLLHPTEKEIVEKIAEDMDMLLTESQRLGLTILGTLAKKSRRAMTAEQLFAKRFITAMTFEEWWHDYANIEGGPNEPDNQTPMDFARRAWVVGFAAGRDEERWSQRGAGGTGRDMTKLSRRLMEVRCCCQPDKLLGYMQIPNRKVREVAFHLRSTNMGPFEDASVPEQPEIVRLPISIFTEHGERYYALKSENVPIETLRRIPEFIEYHGQ